MDIKTAHKLLGPRGSHPTTPAAVNKRLEAIAAGRGLRRPTTAHPYAECFGYTGYIWPGHSHTGQSCADYIKATEAAKALQMTLAG